MASYVKKIKKKVNKKKGANIKRHNRVQALFSKRLQVTLILGEFKYPQEMLRRPSQIDCI